MANLQDMAPDYHVEWDNWDAFPPGDLRIGWDVRNDREMPHIDFVRSSQFVRLLQKPIVQLTRGVDCVEV